jgi:hypothetical protein
MVARVMHTGETMLLATGCDEDRVLGGSHGAGFAEKTVILDSPQIDRLGDCAVVATRTARSSANVHCV